MPDQQASMTAAVLYGKDDVRIEQVPVPRAEPGEIIIKVAVALTCGNFLNSCGNNNGGWLLGAGFEYAFTNHWTVKAEYDYLGLGNRTFVVPAGAPFLAGDTFTSNNRNVQMVKIGVNYLFGGPAATRY